MSRLRTLLLCMCAGAACGLVATPAFAQDTQASQSAGAAKTKADDLPADNPKGALGGLVVSGNKGDKGAGWSVEFFGYVRTQYTAIQNDPTFNQFGRHDGFSIADARLGFDGYLHNGLGFQLEIDAADALRTSDVNSPARQLAALLKDGYLYYHPNRMFRASAGQFKVPFDIEELISTANILFIERSVGNRGVLGAEGPNREGLSLGREVGVRLDSEPIYFGDPNGFGISYAAAVTNGTRAGVSVNDNDKLAYSGRLNLHWGQIVRLGAGVYFNDRLLGELPDQIGETRTGWTADLTAKIAGFTLLSNVIQVDIAPASAVPNEPTRTARSYQVQVAYQEPFWGLQPAYRFAYYDPATNLTQTVDPAFEALTYHTIGLNYNAKTYPVRVMVDYTLTGEADRAIDNDRFDALVQVQW